MIPVTADKLPPDKAAPPAAAAHGIVAAQTRFRRRHEMMKELFIAAACAALSGTAWSQAADDFPDKPIRIVVASAAGGA